MAPLKHHNKALAHSTFGNDRFGRLAERFARFFGTPKFIISQTILVVIWIALNGNLFRLGVQWDIYPFILLNLAFSTQAAYAAPLILLAQTRQADRDKLHAEADVAHREEIADQQKEMLDKLTELIELNTELTEEIHSLVQKQNDVQS